MRDTERDSGDGDARRRLGCGAALGLLVGFGLAMDVTVGWALPGSRVEWPVAVAVCATTTVVVALSVRRWGERAWSLVVDLLVWRRWPR